MENWIDGYFFEFWGRKSYKCSERYIFVPKFATVSVTTVEPHRIHVKESFALSQVAKLERLRRERKYNGADNKHILLKNFCEALNVPWVKEPYVEPRIKTSLW